MQRAKVIPVDFAARRRTRATAGVRPPVPSPPPLPALQALGRSSGFLVFWRPPARYSAAEYLGGRWDWGVLVVLLSAIPVYVAQRLTRQGFVSFLRRADDVGGLLLDGELDGDGHVIRAEPDQLVRRTDALSALGS